MSTSGSVRGIRRQNCIFYVLFLFVFLFLIWKCRYGFGISDEAFYLTIPYRLLQGDGLFLHEWHLSQMGSFLLLPFVFLYLKIVGGTVGIILAFRYIFSIIWALCALFLYQKLSSFSKIGAMISSIVFLLYAPFGIMALSYNSLGILSLAVSVVTFCAEGRHTRLRLCFSGVFFACSVLCCPYLLFVFILYSAGAALYCIFSKNAFRKVFSAWVWFTIGAAAVGLFFSLFVFSRASLSDISGVLVHILNDPEHKRVTLSAKVIELFTSIFSCAPYSLYLYAVYALTIVAAFFVRKKKVLLQFCFIFLLVEIATLLILFLAGEWSINFLMFPINLFPLFAVIASKDAAIRKWTLFGFLPGILYAVCIHFTSNQVFMAISSASTAAAVCSWAILLRYLQTEYSICQTKAMRGILAAACCVLLTVQLGCEGYARYATVFWEKDGMPGLTVLVSEGPEKGVKTTQEKADTYAKLIRSTAAIREDPDIEKVLYLSDYTWLYLLDGEKETASYSAWLSGVNPESMERLRIYYTINPEKVPDAVFFEFYPTQEEDQLLLKTQVQQFLTGQLGLEETKTESNGIIYSKPERLL